MFRPAEGLYHQKCTALNITETPSHTSSWARRNLAENIKKHRWHARPVWLLLHILSPFRPAWNSQTRHAHTHTLLRICNCRPAYFHHLVRCAHSHWKNENSRVCRVCDSRLMLVWKAGGCPGFISACVRNVSPHAGVSPPIKYALHTG